MGDKFEIILIGTGFYVCGAKKKDFGTILPAIFTFAKINKISIEIVVSINRYESLDVFSKKFQILKDLLNTGELVSFKHIFCEGSSQKFLSKYKQSNRIVAGIISIPDHLHFDWAEALLKVKIPLLVVKPLTLKLEESIKLDNLSREFSTPVFVEFHKRFDRQLKYAKDCFKSGLIGIPLYAYTEYTQKKEVPLENFRTWAEKSNIFSYLGVHYVDAMKYVTNSTPRRLNASGQKYFLSENDLDTYDSIQCNIVWETQNNTFFNQLIMSSWVESNNSSSMSKQDFHIIGTKGRIDCEQKERGLKILTDNNPTEEVNPDFSRIYSQNNSYLFEGYGIDSIKNFLDNIFNQSIDKQDSRICSIEDALVSTSVIESALESLKYHSKWVEIK